MKRSEQPIEYQWDLSAFIQDETQFQKIADKATNLMEKLLSQKNHICECKASFQQFFDDLEELDLAIEDLYVYSSMSNDVNKNDTVSQKHLSIATLLMNQRQQKFTFIELECLAHQQTIEEYLKDEALKDYRYPMQCIFKTKPHRLDEEQETLLAEVSELVNQSEDTYRALQIKFKDVIVDGKPEFLNDGTYRQFLLNKDRKVRKQAFENYLTGFMNHSYPLSILWTSHIKGKSLLAKRHHFKNAMEASLFEDDVNEDLVHLILNVFNHKYIKGMHDYMQLKKECLGYEELHIYDNYVPIVEGVDHKYTIEKAFDILKKALRPLGDDYVLMLDTIKQQRWIDFLPSENKRGGAYSWGTYHSYPYICTNYNESYDSLSTLAHELGHSMHSYYSNKNNRAMLSGYRIFVAEIASTVNEVLLNHYFMENSDDKTKTSLCYQMLETCVGTLYRQAFFADFEETIYQKVEAKQPISNQEIMELYMEKVRHHYGEAVTIDELQKAHCYSVPHFYYNFYVYKYTLGLSIALAFAKRILSGDVETYRKFLTIGGSMSPVDTLRSCGIDPYDEKVYDDAYQYFENTLEQFKELIKK